MLKQRADIMEAFTLTLLGGFQIHTADGKPLPPISDKKAKALLGYLAMTGRVLLPCG